jgi:hypothetical protein
MGDVRRVRVEVALDEGDLLARQLEEAHPVAVEGRRLGPGQVRGDVAGRDAALRGGEHAGVGELGRRGRDDGAVADGVDAVVPGPQRPRIGFDPAAGADEVGAVEDGRWGVGGDAEPQVHRQRRRCLRCRRARRHPAAEPDRA